MMTQDSEPILPSIFLPIIQADYALTEAFGTWFLDRAFADASKMMNALKVRLTVSINVMAFQANRPEFVMRVLELMDKHHLESDNVQIELSEVQPLDEIGTGNLKRIHDEYGISLVLGTSVKGFSNIDLLRRIPFSIIKSAKSFVKEIESLSADFKVIIGILEMAKVMDIHVCAKGIETPEQMEMLEEAGFTMGQGFLIGKPLVFE